MASKLGFHIDIRTYPGQVEKILAAKPAAVKVIASMGLLQQLHEALGDSTIFIAKSLKVTDDFHRFGAWQDPMAAAHEWFKQAEFDLKQAPFAYWESFNEMATPSDLDLYGLFEAERQRIMHEEGYKACILNFSTGFPRVDDPNDDWNQLYPALAAANEYRNILGLHEYGGLFMDMWYGPNQTDAVLAGKRVPYPKVHEEGWLFGRYRKIHRLHLYPNHWDKVRIALTEFGLDFVATEVVTKLTGAPTSGWKTCQEAWKKLLNREDGWKVYLEQLLWADSQLQDDFSMVGAAIFTWGTMGDWDAYEIEGQVADKVIEHIRQSSNSVPETIKLVEIKPIPIVSDVMYVTPTASVGLRVRKLPNTHSPTLEIVMPGMKLKAFGEAGSVRKKLGMQGQWIQLVTPKKSVGWCAAWHLKEYSQAYKSEIGNALIGVHGPADPAMWAWNDEVYNVIRQSKVQTVKLLASSDIQGSVVVKLRDLGVKFIMARLFVKPYQIKDAETFFHEMKGPLLTLYNEGVRYFEVHNEPNLADEGFGTIWWDGGRFGDIFTESVEMFKQLVPEAKFGFPGLSPGNAIVQKGSVPGEGTIIRYSAELFMDEANEAVREADFICMHTYWGGDGSTYHKSVNEVLAFCDRFPNKLVMVTEFSNTSPSVSKETKAQEYLLFYDKLQGLRSNLGAMYSFIVSASSGFEHETWIDSEIPAIVGNRMFGV
jgi:hypothetical protein